MDLTTVERFKNYANITTDAAGDAVIGVIVSVVSEFVRQYCGRTFVETVHTNELHDGKNTNSLLLINYPVNSSEEFTLQGLDTSFNEDQWTTWETKFYFISYEEGTVRGAGDKRFLQGRNNYRVIYTAGYDFDNITTFLADTGAADLEFAVWYLMKSIWFDRGKDPNVESERIGDFSLTYRSGIMDLVVTRFRQVPFAQVILDKYRRLAAHSVVAPTFL